MLQQTQVASVIPYFNRFIARFPTLAALAAAPLDDVMALWSGLGYYARARNLHACARLLLTAHDGQLPRTPAALTSLPGIGRSTANAIAAFCFGVAVPILDGNVKRLLCRVRGIAGYPGLPAVESRLWQDAEALLPRRNVDTYIQAQMDLGATVCTRSKPRCTACPVADLCVARRESRIAELPAARPRKTLPERQVCLLVLYRERDAAVLLEPRPATGIWGGLLSLPELPAAIELQEQDSAGIAAIAAYCTRQFGLGIGAVLPAPTFIHSFTHFRLTIRPLRCTVTATLPTLAEPRLRWTSRTKLAEAALPAPIRKILNATL